VSRAPCARDRDIIEEPTDWASAHYSEHNKQLISEY
jgi:hypothetical protein